MSPYQEPALTKELREMTGPQPTGAELRIMTTPQGRLRRLTEPAVLFPLLAAALLSVIWTATFELIKLNDSDAEHVAAVSCRELLEPTKLRWFALCARSIRR